MQIGILNTAHPRQSIRGGRRIQTYPEGIQSIVCILPVIGICNGSRPIKSMLRIILQQDTGDFRYR